MSISEQVLGGFKTGMTRSSRRGGKDGAQKLWTLQNGYVTDQGDVVPRPGLQHVANVANSSGLYGADGQLHVFYGDTDGFVDPGNALIESHLLRYPLLDLSIGGDLPDGNVGTVGSYQYSPYGGTGPYSFYLVSGSLPTGATLSSTGLVTYQYQVAGEVSNWVVGMTDATGLTVTLADSATVGKTIQGIRWKYKVNPLADTTPYFAVNVDDSDWLAGLMPFASQHWDYPGTFGFPTDPATLFPLQSRIWLRATVHFDELPASLSLDCFQDNDLWVYINGVQIAQHSQVNGGHYVYSAPSSALVVGDNQITIRVDDDVASNPPDYAWADIRIIGL